MPETSLDILSRERIHLEESRAALARMRRHTASLQAFGGDHVSTEHLKQDALSPDEGPGGRPDCPALLRPT